MAYVSVTTWVSAFTQRANIPSRGKLTLSVPKCPFSLPTETDNSFHSTHNDMLTETCSPLELVENPNNPFKSPLSISDMTPFIPSVFVLQQKLVSLPLWFLHKMAFNRLPSGFHGPQEINSYQWLTFLVNMEAKKATEAWEGCRQPEILILIYSLSIF